MNFLYGEALMKERNDWAGAAAAFRAELEIDPNHFESNLLLGTLLREGGQSEEALARLEHASRLRGEDLAVKFSLGAAYLAAGRSRRRGGCSKRWGGRAGSPADADAAGDALHAAGPRRGRGQGQGQRRAAHEGGRRPFLPGRTRVHQRPRGPLGRAGARRRSREPRPGLAVAVALGLVAVPVQAAAPSAVRGTIVVKGVKSNADAVVTLEAPGLKLAPPPSP